MTTLTSVALVCASPQQEAALETIIRASGLNTFPEMGEAAFASELADIRLLVHAEVRNTASEHDLSTALEGSPTVISGNGEVALLTGANEVDSYLSSALSVFVRGKVAASLLIPHSYALEDEIDSLVARNQIPMRFQAGHVYYCFDATNSAPDSINKALGSCIAMYSVAWILGGSGCDYKPILAFIPVFDGDGWALAGSIDALFPALRCRMH
jgi:hypothetical protein